MAPVEACACCRREPELDAYWLLTVPARDVNARILCGRPCAEAGVLNATQHA